MQSLFYCLPCCALTLSGNILLFLLFSTKRFISTKISCITMSPGSSAFGPRRSVPLSHRSALFLFKKRWLLFLTNNQYYLCRDCQMLRKKDRSYGSVPTVRLQSGRLRDDPDNTNHPHYCQVSVFGYLPGVVFSGKRSHFAENRVKVGY